MSIHKSLLYTIPAVWATRAIAILDFLFIIRSSESGTSEDAPPGLLPGVPAHAETLARQRASCVPALPFHPILKGAPL